MSDIAVRVENLSKRYRIGLRESRPNTLVQRTFELARQPLRNLRRLRGLSHFNADAAEAPDTIWALRDVSFDIKQGEAVGIIGRNGAGKSTLLKILSRITFPTTGRVTLHGRVASLLEVGTGFHPELTGRDNIYMNGTILGMRKSEIDRKLDEIVAFAEIDKFLDTPVKRYSSGMYVRLAFAVAAHLEPEILIVDEVLAVGDAEFQRKCLGRMDEVAKAGRTVLFVSHQLNAIGDLCNRGLLLAGGRVALDGPVSSVVGGYLRRDRGEAEWIAHAPVKDLQNRYFDPKRFALIDRNKRVIAGPIRADAGFGVLIEGVVEVVDIALTIGFALYGSTGNLLFWALHTDTRREDWPPIREGANALCCWVPGHLLNEGDYRVELILSLHFAAWLCEPGRSSPVLFLSVRGGLSESPYWMMARPGQMAPVLSFARVSPFAITRQEADKEPKD